MAVSFVWLLWLDGGVVCVGDVAQAAWRSLALFNGIVTAKVW